MYGTIVGEQSFLLPDLIFETPAESYFELSVRATGSPLAFLATGLPGGMSINPADGNLSGIPVQAGAYKINLEAYYLDQSIILFVQSVMPFREAPLLPLLVPDWRRQQQNFHWQQLLVQIFLCVSYDVHNVRILYLAFFEQKNCQKVL